MSENWLEMHIKVPVAAADLVGDALMDLGCSGVTVVEHVLDTFEAPAEILPEGDTLTLRAYFPETDDPEPLRQAIYQRLCELTAYLPQLTPALPECHRLASEDWASNWRQHFSPFRVGERLVIQPSWVETDPAGAETVLILDPGRAFGTGTHATTSLCLDALAEIAASEQPPARVLDVGTGSGILAMAAAALGATQVLACEIDPEACQVAEENIALNHLSERITVTNGLLEELDGTFDLVFANILAKENIRLAPHLLARMHPGSYLLLSGILNEQEAEVIAAFAAWPLTRVDILRRQEWSCLVYRHHG